ncbi:MAG: hypothetical protein JWO30_634 [Fibrobacteres bacterium]|nr:hypothetical protein [Fibrobacterota bacterium]
MSRNKKIFYIGLGFGVALVFLFIFRAWKNRDTRPTLEDAEAKFKETYPGVRILNLKITEDEIYARNFLFQYLKPGSETGKSIEIQFMKEKETGRWVPAPPAPADLK